VLGSSKEPASLETFAKIARLHGEKPYLAGAVVSGLAGREAAFIDLVATDSSANKAASVVALAASAVLRSKNVEQSTALFARLDPASSSPDWVRSAVLDGVQQFLPRGGGRGRTVAVATTLPAEPKGLVALAAAKSHSASERAAAILPSLQWPGKEGFAAPVVAARMNRDQRALFEKGQAQYAMLCAACHQPNGQGMPGLAPQLVNSRYVVGPSDNLARIILNGKEGGGLMMPPLGSLDDEAIAGVMTYLRRSWGHTASTVTPAAVKKVREDSTRRTQPWTDEELLALAKE
jgi:mono/diheme cytochrome c family protein